MQNQITDSEFVDKILAIPAESRTLEFKRLGGSRNSGIDKTLESIVAMTNTDGGCIVLGIDDPEKSNQKGVERIYGIEENLELYDELGRAVKKINPPIPDIWPPIEVNVEEKRLRISLVFIPKAADQFRTVENHVYVRLEKGNKILNPQEIVHFSYVKGFLRADKEPVDVDFSLLKTKHYDEWRKNRNISDDDPIEVFKKTGLARPNEQGQWRPLRAAVLLFADYPSDLMDTKCVVRVSQYLGKKIEIRGDTLNLLGIPKNIGGPIIKQIRDVCDYVLTLLRIGLRVPNGFVTTYQIPERAVKEGITNAIIHRDYGAKRDVEIRLFEDRLEIESPGLLPFNITPSNIGFERATGYRNDLLVKHLREFPDPPNLDQNEGVRLMRAKMKDAKLYPPIFITYPDPQDAVRLILWNEKAPSEWDKVSQHLSKNGKYITNMEVRSLLGINDTVAVSKLLSKWVKQGLLIKIIPRAGAKKNVRYRLPAAQEVNLFTLTSGK